MTKKITLTILIIAALLVAIYKWIMSSDDNEEDQKVEETETANEKETVEPEEKIEEIKENGEDIVNENHK